MKSSEIKEKVAQTTFKNHGYYHYLQSPEALKKMKERYRSVLLSKLHKFLELQNLELLTPIEEIKSVFSENNGVKVPITEKVVMPKVEGAIILAEGANDASIKNNIILAVEAVTGLSTHKIQVFQLKS